MERSNWPVPVKRHYDTAYQDQIVGDAGVFIHSLQVKN